MFKLTFFIPAVIFDIRFWYFQNFFGLNIFFVVGEREKEKWSGKTWGVNKVGFNKTAGTKTIFFSFIALAGEVIALYDLWTHEWVCLKITWRNNEKAPDKFEQEWIMIMMKIMTKINMMSKIMMMMTTTTGCNCESLSLGIEFKWV